jgi:hypothetical protein
MPRGYKQYEEKRQAAAEGAGGSGIYGLKLLEDQESCKIRFLTDHEDIYWDWFHRKMENGEFRGMKICPRSLGNACEDCQAAKVGDDKRKASMQVLAWVFEFEHYYTEPKEDRKKVQLGAATRYMKVVNEPKLFRYAGAHMKAIEPTITRKGTLIDRDYEWIRAGKKGDNKPQYTLEQSGEPSDLTDELQTLALALPDLEDVALGRVTSLSGEKTETGATYGTVQIEEEEPTPFQDVEAPTDGEEEPF